MLNVKSFSLVGFIKKPYVNVSSNLVSLRDLEIDSQPREVSETHTAEQYISCYVKKHYLGRHHASPHPLSSLIKEGFCNRLRIMVSSETSLHLQLKKNPCY